ncbi:hypothetical protein [Streptomyces sp. NPDC059850]|uniref:hypothetical protein n=1 Tax=Streptomyces sp. NPDC059850 TaxID=3346970 RepID=UPI00365C217B
MYATEGDLARVVGGFHRLLDEDPEAYELAVVAVEDRELYEELPQQWRCQYPGADPGERGVYEVRVGLARSGRSRMDEVREALTRVICPDPEHASPCPVPWAAGYTAGRCDVSLEKSKEAGKPGR